MSGPAASRHTPGPWHIGRIAGQLTGVYDATGAQIADCSFGLPCREAKANAARIVACVVACEGMADPAAEIAKLRADKATLIEGFKECVRQREALSADNARLLEVLKKRA